MPINFICPHCQNQMLVADEFAGKTGPCSSCQQTITIPGAAQLPAGNPYAQPMQAPPYQQAPHQQYPPIKPRESELGMRILLPVDRSILAIIAGYMGLFSLLCFPAPFALILGILAVVDIKKHPKKHGLGRAWFAIVMGTLFTIVPIVTMLMM